uniref:Integrase catalytic domain-containing protein n=1 Tax=Trichuris muris TaxID=70415 RepID=A0A5S6Q1J3_TRIMR
MAFRRLIGRRGTPAVVYSDNGTNLVAAERELRTCIDSWNQQRTEEVFFQRRIRWKFSPPTAPHFSGVWERLVRPAKVALKKVLNGQAVSDEMLSTAMVEIESLMNSRPLTHIPIDLREPEPLTLNHLLLGRSHPHIPPDLVSETEITSKRKWRAAQAIVESCWKRWQREYVPYLLERRRWVRPTRNLQVDDIVLVIDPQNTREHWVLGRVTECNSGQDGTVRVVRGKTNRGTYLRPVTKLCLMETRESDVSEDRSETGPAMLPIPRLSTESLRAINQNEGERVNPEIA